MALATARDWYDTRVPRLFVNDYGLRKKLGGFKSLGDIITPEILESAQLTVSRLSDSSLDWVSRSIESLQSTFTKMKEYPADRETLANLIQTAYEIEGIAGTMSFRNAASIARSMRIFFQEHYNADNELHQVVAEKHLDVLLVTFSQLLKGNEVPGFDEILRELNNLALRVS